jgi:hypothetical protein
MNLSMEKILSVIGITIFIILFAALGWVIGESIIDIVGYPLNVLFWVAIVCSIIYAYRKNKDGMYQLFRDVHQSNLDDIEAQEQEKEEANT